jgi:hypothetical protein
VCAGEGRLALSRERSYPVVVGVVMRWQLTVNREVDDECAIRESQIRMGKAMIRRGVEEGDEDEAQPGSNGMREESAARAASTSSKKELV